MLLSFIAQIRIKHKLDHLNGNSETIAEEINNYEAIYQNDTQFFEKLDKFSDTILTIMKLFKIARHNESKSLIEEYNSR